MMTRWPCIYLLPDSTHEAFWQANYSVMDEVSRLSVRQQIRETLGNVPDDLVKITRVNDTEYVSVPLVAVEPARWIH
jgi:hypothetical protein